MLGRKNGSQAPKVLEVDANFQGNLVFKDAVNLKITGHFEGRLETQGELTLAETATVRADIAGSIVRIAGAIEGCVTALLEVHLLPGAKVVGDIHTPVLVTERGALFSGQSFMGRAELPARHADRVVLSSEEVAHYLSVERELVSRWAEEGKLPGVRQADDWIFNKEAVDQWIANGRIQ